MPKRKYGGIENPPDVIGQPPHRDARVEYNDQLGTQLARYVATLRLTDTSHMTLPEKQELAHRIALLEERLSLLREEREDMIAEGRGMSDAGWEEELAKAVERDQLSQEDAATAKKLIADAIAARDAAMARATARPQKSARAGSIPRPTHNRSTPSRTNKRPSSFLKLAHSHSHSHPPRSPSRRGWSDGGTYKR